MLRTEAQTSDARRSTRRLPRLSAEAAFFLYVHYLDRTLPTIGRTTALAAQRRLAAATGVTIQELRMKERLDRPASCSRTRPTL